MFSASDLILALQRRMLLRAPHRRRPAGEFPPGWQNWFDAMRERGGGVTGATSDAVVEEFLQRPLATPPRRVGELTRWQAFTTLWRQQWHPAEREDRGVRWFAAGVSVLWHLLFGALLVWLMYLRFMALTAPAPAEGESVVQVEYIGRGTPQQAGGPQQQPTPTAQRPTPTAQRPTPSAPSAQTPAAAERGVEAPAFAEVPTEAAPTVDTEPPQIAPREVPEPPAAEQPVAVSEPVPSAPSVFVLPPTRRRVEEPTLAAPDLNAPQRQVRAVEVPEPLRQPEPRPVVPQRPVEAPTIAARTPEVATREVPAPLQRPMLPEMTAPRTAAPELRAPTPNVRTAEIPSPQKTATTPAPAGAPARPAAAAASPAQAAAQADAQASAPDRNAATPASQRPATAGTGPKPTAAPGSWPTPTRGDDWGESARNRPGAQSGASPGPGLYNKDGSVRIAETPGSASPGMPPGTVTEEIKDLDRAGTWLKRKPNDYEPTAFDKYWRPSETLLQEWVRKSIKRVAIPIPGSSKRIVCDVALLAFGGGCGIVDPNLNEQPAGARPPPDIPFKPQLQEDNGSVKPKS